jgi:hypothetical protein
VQPFGSGGFTDSTHAGSQGSSGSGG